jgi:signal transduction histidine kinase
MRRVLLSALLVLLGCSSPPPVAVTQLWDREVLDVWPGTYKCDTIDNLIAVLSDATVEPRDQNMHSAGNTTSFPAGTLGRAAVAAGAVDSTHAWVTYKHCDTAFLYDLRDRRKLVVAVGLDRDATIKGWDGNISEVRVADVNGDGRMEVLARVTSSWDISPRAIVELDWDEGRQIGRYDCGPSPENMVLSDIDSDGRDEVLLGTWAPLNGNTANGLSDSFTYAIALDCRLAPIWTTQLGRYSSTVHVAVINRGKDASPVLLACELGNSAGGRHCDSIWLLDPKNGRRLCGMSSGSFNTGFAILEDSRRGTLAVTAGSDDTVRVYDSRLRVVGSRHVSGVGAGVELCAGHFTGSRSQEVAANCGVTRVLVFDSRLRTTTEIPAMGAGGLRQVRHGSFDRLLLRTQTDTTSRWHLYEMQIVPFAQRGIAPEIALPAFALLLLLLATSIVYGRYRLTRDMRAVVRGLTGQAGVVELGVRGQVRHTNQKARELLGGEVLPAGPLVQAVHSALAEPLGSAPRELPVALGGGKTVLARAARVRSGVMLTLEDISAVEYLQRVKAWAPVAQKLAHGIKNPLGTIMGAVEQIEAEVNRSRTKAEARGERLEARSPDEEVRSQEPEAKAEEQTSAEARRERLEARSQESETRTLGPADPRTPLSDERVRKYIRYVKDEVIRLKKMTDAFMRFTKLNPPELKLRDVNEIVRKVVARYGWENGDSPRPRERDRNPVQSPFSHGISLELDLDEKLPPVAVDEEGMANVLDIVIENAVEAMTAEVGSRQHTADRVLRIRTAAEAVGSRQNAVDRAVPAGRSQMSDARSEKPEVRTRTSTDSTDGPARIPAPSDGERRAQPLDPGTRVSIEVEDTGMGIPEKYLQKVFEPYFTHGKPDGTGLGMALAKKIVEDHKGRMEIRSREGEGTTVTITLPTELGGR